MHMGPLKGGEGRSEIILSVLFFLPHHFSCYVLLPLGRARPKVRRIAVFGATQTRTE
jgi:hypothetical protein